MTIQKVQMPAGKKPCGNPPDAPNVFVDVVLSEPLNHIVSKFVRTMKVLDDSSSALEGCGAVGLGMDRQAGPHSEIVTELDHRPDYHYHRYDVYKIAPPISVCCWKGYYAHFTVKPTGAGSTKVEYRGYMDVRPWCPCFGPALISTIVKGDLTKTLAPSPGAIPRA